MQTNVLYNGDNRDILRRYLPDATVDLVELDPPFNSIATTTSSSATSRTMSVKRRQAWCRLVAPIGADLPAEQMDRRAGDHPRW